ncbi:hypothetical protein BS17DRAFT_662995, partial [Gyrodon lividus]
MHRTAWSISGSLPSDRIRPQQPLSSAPQKQQQSKGKGKGKAAPPKSQVIRTLESLADGVRRSSGAEKDPKGGCFCQARQHTLSAYVPLCQRCGLVLCTLNLPCYACPHCAGALLDASHRSALAIQLEEALAAQITKEEGERQRAIEEARIAAGAFPLLPGSQPPKPPSKTQTQTHKVLSLNAKTKRVTVSSYTNTPVPSRPASRAEDVPLEDQRVPAPPSGINYVKLPPDPSRPWRNVRAGELRYVAP